MKTLPQPCLDALPLGAHRLLTLTDQALYEQLGVRVAFTGREGGVSTGPYASLNLGAHVDDDPQSVAHNRALVLEALAEPNARLVVPNQVHGTQVVSVNDLADVDRAQQEASKGADALLVATPGVAVLFIFADCLPLVLVSPTGRFVVAHAGWRGVVAGIAGKAARALVEADDAQADPSEYNAYMGPHIGPECFEVGQDVCDCFVEAFGHEVVAGPRYVSLAKAVAVDLVRAGMSPERICNCGICTKCNPEQYFSYRASDGRCGRHAAIAYREEG